MDIIYGLGRASATQVLEAMTDPPSRAAVRTFLRILEEKGHLKHGKEGREYIYQPTQPRKRIGKSSLRHVINTFFEGSMENALAMHLSDPKNPLTHEELRRLEALIRKARKEKTKKRS